MYFERDFRRGAQRVCQAERSLMSPFGQEEETFVRLSTKLSQVSVNLIVYTFTREFVLSGILMRYKARLLLSFCKRKGLQARCSNNY